MNMEVNNKEIRNKFKIGTDKVDESISIHEDIKISLAKIEGIKQQIADLTAQKGQKEAEVENSKANIEGIKSEIARLQDNLVDKKNELAENETTLRETEGTILSLKDNIAKENYSINELIQLIETQKIRAEELYQVGQEMINEAKATLESNVPNDVKDRTIEIPSAIDMDGNSFNKNGYSGFDDYE